MITLLMPLAPKRPHVSVFLTSQQLSTLSITIFQSLVFHLCLAFMALSLTGSNRSSQSHRFQDKWRFRSIIAHFPVFPTPGI